MAPKKKHPAYKWTACAFVLALLAGLVLTAYIEYDRIRQ